MPSLDRLIGNRVIHFLMTAKAMVLAECGLVAQLAQWRMLGWGLTLAMVIFNQIVEVSSWCTEISRSGDEDFKLAIFALRG